MRSVFVLHDKGTGNEIGPVILNGRPDKGMPEFTFNEAQIKDLAAFLFSRTQAAANRMEYKILNIVTGDPRPVKLLQRPLRKLPLPVGRPGAHRRKFEAGRLQSRFLYPIARIPRNPARPPIRSAREQL